MKAETIESPDGSLPVSPELDGSLPISPELGVSSTFGSTDFLALSAEGKGGDEDNETLGLSRGDLAISGDTGDTQIPGGEGKGELVSEGVVGTLEEGGSPTAAQVESDQRGEEGKESDYATNGETTIDEGGGTAGGEGEQVPVDD